MPETSLVTHAPSMLARFTTLAAIALAAACGEKPVAAPSKQLNIAPSPSERPVAPKPAPPAASTPAGQPATETPAPRTPPAPYQMKTDPQSVLIRANATLSYRIDKFKEDNGRFPRSLAEAGLDKLDLPPGKKVSYNSGTGAYQIVDK